VQSPLIIHNTSIHYKYSTASMLSTLCYRRHVRPSVCLSVCHTGGSVRNGWSSFSIIYNGE